ncbi:MAG: hypothetical protein JXR05_09695 [Flavobacteriaceae bacterium]
MSVNLNSIYHKGRYRNGEWGKHLRPYQKRLGNKRFRKTGKLIVSEIDPHGRVNFPRKKKRLIKVKIRHKIFGEATTTEIKRFHSLRDANNAIKRNGVIEAIFLD